MFGQHNFMFAPVKIAPVYLVHLVFLLSVQNIFASLAIANNIDFPEWWGNDIGKEEIVLPGYGPVLVKNENDIELSAGRLYKWNKSYLPSQILSRNEILVKSSYVEIGVNGEPVRVEPDTVRILEKKEHHAVLQAVGTLGGVLEIIVTTRVEYDGVAMVEMELIPFKPVLLDYMNLVFTVNDNDWMKLLVFKPDDIGKRINKVVYEPEFNSGFLSALALVDGEKSFWLFQDNAKGWVGDLKDVVSVARDNGYIEIKQKLISTKVELKNKKLVAFNFMATPVRAVVGNIRQNRVARNKSKIESRHHGLHLWWINAFAHQVFPYTSYPENIEKKISVVDKQAYPGLVKNREILRQYKNFGIDRLPYFSAHVLNHYDPAYKRFKESWELHPKIHWNKLKYDKPFKSLRNDTFLTHRAEGYTDYLIYRYSRLIDELGFEGLYFDQGGVRQSANPLNGLWLDDKGVKRASTDILALRNFHKRLATLFYLKGKKGLIVSHNSNDMIIPAYTFTTSMVQGEEFNHWLRDYDYIGSVTLDEVRTRLSGGAFGVPTIWLEVIFAESKRLHKSERPGNMSKKAWHESSYYADAYKNFLALALLHDMPTWSYADLHLRTEVFNKIDWIEPETATFTGYWNYPEKDFKGGVYSSHYRAKDGDRFLFVVSNLSSKDQVVNLDHLLASLNLQQTQLDKCDWVKNSSDGIHNYINSINVKAKRFELLPLRCH